MNKVADLLKPVKERLSNPFIFSYLIAWLIFNWVIVLGIFRYTIEQLSRDGYASYLDLVNKNSNPFRLFWWPLTSAFAYTFLFPIFRNCIIAFRAWEEKWGTTWSLNISKGGKIPVEKYLELRNDYSKRTKSLEQALKSETQFIGENHALTDAVRQLQIGNDKMMNEAAKTRSYCETKTYDGDWEMTYRPDPSGYTTKRARLIQGNVGVNINGEEKEVFKIIKIGYDSTSNEIIMIIADSREVDVPFHIIFRPQSLSLSILKNADEKGVITALVRP